MICRVFFFALVKEAPSAKEKTFSKEAFLPSVKKTLLKSKSFQLQSCIISKDL